MSDKPDFKIPDRASYNSTYRMGDIFRSEKDYYILGKVSPNKVVLLNLSDGNRWTSPADIPVVNDAIYISDFEEKIDRGKKFKRVDGSLWIKLNTEK